MKTYRENYGSSTYATVIGCLIQRRVKDGYLVPEIFPLSDFPNDLLTMSDLKRLGIYFEDGVPIFQLVLMPYPACGCLGVPTNFAR